MNVLDDIASFFLCLACEPSHWYTLNCGFDDESHLSHRFGMSQDDYEKLLITAGLASFIGGKLDITV
jgi:hypothetical protein